MRKNIMSEEAFNELIDGFEYVGNLTDYGRKNIKYHVQKLQQENKQLKDNWNKLKEYLTNFLPTDKTILTKYIKIFEVLNKMQELEQGSGSDE